MLNNAGKELKAKREMEAQKKVEKMFGNANGNIEIG